MPAVLVVRWLSALPFLFLGGYIIAMNAVIAVRGLLGVRPNASLGPLLGGCLACVGVLLMPIQGASRWWYVPFLIDFGSVPSFSITAVWHIRRYLRERGHRER